MGASDNCKGLDTSPAGEVSDPVRILYVDDDPDFLEVVKIILEQNGEFSVDTTTSGKKALELVKIGRYDLVLSDYRMARMDGITLLRGVREQDSHLPFILFTGMVNAEIVAEASRSGVTLHMLKEGDTVEQFRRLEEGIREVVLQSAEKGMAHTRTSPQ